MGDKVGLPAVEEGDLVAVFQSGAYGASASPNRFLGHPVPTEILT
jgi:diaminopimelate decarboxylase